MTNPIDDLLVTITAKITRATTVEEGARVFILSVPQMIADAVAQAQASGAMTPEQLAAFTNLGAALEAKTEELNAALAAITPQG